MHRFLLFCYYFAALLYMKNYFHNIIIVTNLAIANRLFKYLALQLIDKINGTKENH